MAVLAVLGRTPRCAACAFALLIACYAPAHACLNDSVISAEEATFRERYAEVHRSHPVYVWGQRALVLGSLGVAGLLGFGFWFWHREQQAAVLAAARRRRRVRV